VSRLKALPTFIAFYVGRDDWRFSAENEQLNQELSRAGVPHVFRLGMVVSGAQAVRYTDLP